MAYTAIFKFIVEENKTEYKANLLMWLEADFLQKGEKSTHFWHNKNNIAEAFDNCNALIIVNDHKKLIGYMTWHIYAGVAAEINFVEVLEGYRHQGLFKQMLKVFSQKFTDICILTATVPSQSEEIFNKIGWGSATGINHNKKYFRVMQPVLRQLDKMPTGHVIAVCSKNYDKVAANPNKYKHLMKYFRIILDKDGKLQEPLVTSFIHTGYIGMYLNKELIVQGSPERLFDTTETSIKTAWAIQDVFLVINKIVSHEPRLLDEKWLSSKPQPEIPIQIYSNNNFNHPRSLHSPTTDSSDIELFQHKKPRIETNSAFFAPLQMAPNEKEADTPIAQPIIANPL